MPVTSLPPIVNIGSGEVLPGAAISVAGMLRSGVTLTGTPTLTVTPATPTPIPTATSPVVSSTTLTINGVQVTAGEAIQFTLSGNGAAKRLYSIAWSCGSSDGGTLQGAVPVKVL